MSIYKQNNRCEQRTSEATTKLRLPTGQGTITHSSTKFSGTSSIHSDSISCTTKPLLHQCHWNVQQTSNTYAFARSQRITGRACFSCFLRYCWGHSNTKFGQFKETFSPFHLAKFHWHLLNGSPLRGNKLQKSHVRFLWKNAFSNLCPFLPTTGNTSEKFYVSAQLHSFRYTKA